MTSLILLSTWEEALGASDGRFGVRRRRAGPAGLVGDELLRNRPRFTARNLAEAVWLARIVRGEPAGMTAPRR